MTPEAQIPEDADRPRSTEPAAAPPAPADASASGGAPPAAAPETPARQAFPDRLRAAALLGIVLVNAPMFAYSESDAAAAAAARGGEALDRLSAVFVAVCAQGKFFLIFSFLFGYSAHFVLKDGGPEGRAAFGRRLAALGLLGAVHVAVAFVGDILVSYAVLGCTLLYWLRRSDASILKACALILAATTLWLYAFMRVAAAFPRDGDGASAPETDALASAIAHGSFFDACAARVAYWPVVFFALAVLQWGHVLAAFALGFVAGRRGALADVGARAAFWRRLAVFGVGLGLPLQIAIVGLPEWRSSVFGEGDAAATGTRLAATAAGLACAPILSAGYVGLFALWSRRDGAFLRWIEPAGRMSLSCYVAHSLLLSWFCCGYGLGRFDRLGPAALHGFALLCWSATVIAARWWLSRFARGPLETVVAACARGARRRVAAFDAPR